MKKYRSFIIPIVFTMGTQAILFFLIKLFIHNYNVIHSFLSVPFIKWSIYFYDSWYPFIVFNAFIIYFYDKNEFRYLITAMLLAALFGQITFISYPSLVIRPEIEVHTITDWLIDFTYKNDTPAINCLPSMHCIYCFLTSYYTLKCKNIINKYKVLIILYSLIIVASTLFTYQHIIEDVILSFVYSIVAIVIVYYNKNNIIKIFKKLKL